MNPPPDGFDALRKLLALKRHESPPPGYFNRFADRVIAQLEAEGALPAPAWWQQWWEALASPPVRALGYGAAVVALLLLGTGLLRTLELEADPVLAASQPWLARDSLSMTSPAPSPVQLAGPAEFGAAGPGSSFSPVWRDSAPPFVFAPTGQTAERVSYQQR